MAVALLSLLVLVQVALAVGGHGVPVLLWTSENLRDDLPRPLAGHSLRERDFRDTYVQPLSEGKALIVFLQDELSLEDFLQYRDAFKNIQVALQPGRSLTFPSVFDPTAAVRSAAHRHSNVLELSDPSGADRLLSELQLDTDTALYVRLHPTVGVASARSAMQQNDELVGKVLKKLRRDAVPFVAVYTTHSLRVPRDVVIQGAGRRLLATSSNDTQGIRGYYLTGDSVNATACAMLYVDDIVLGVQIDPANASRPWGVTKFGKSELRGNITCICKNGNDTFNCPSRAANATLPMLNVTSAIVILSVPGPIAVANGSRNITTFSISLTMGRDDRYTNSRWWVVKKVGVQLDNSTVTFVNHPVLDSITAPLAASYHCWSPPTLRPGTPSNSSNDTSLSSNCTGPICFSNNTDYLEFNLTFVNLQIQGVDVTKYFAFGAPYDCTTFFTIPTYMGLFTALILIVLTIFGITMLARIETFDQFDDPKGKTIVVSNTE